MLKAKGWRLRRSAGFTPAETAPILEASVVYFRARRLPPVGHSALAVQLAAPYLPGRCRLSPVGLSKESSSSIVRIVKDQRMVATDEDASRAVQNRNGGQDAFEAWIPHRGLASTRQPSDRPGALPYLLGRW